MADRSSLCREGRRGGCHCSRCVGGRGTDSKGKEVVENQGMGSGDEHLGERWYNMENSAAERRSLSRLEQELDAAFRFEQGGGQGSSPVWLTQILLGRLLRERLVLGRAIKMFTKFQRREIMCCMVKLNDLEELAEPPLGGTPGASPSTPPQEEAMDLEEEVGRTT